MKTAFEPLPRKSSEITNIKHVYKKANETVHFLNLIMEVRHHASLDKRLRSKKMQISAGYELKLIVLIICILVEQTASWIIIVEQHFFLEPEIGTQREV